MALTATANQTNAGSGKNRGAERTEELKVRDRVRAEQRER